METIKPIAEKKGLVSAFICDIQESLKITNSVNVRPPMIFEVKSSIVGVNRRDLDACDPIFLLPRLRTGNIFKGQNRDHRAETADHFPESREMGDFSAIRCEVSMPSDLNDGLHGFDG
jgi:hypothetical protein